MQTDQQFLLWGIIGLNLAMLAAHALRGRITLASVFALAGVFSMMLWQILQMGWWVDVGNLHFNAGLVAFIPPLLMGALLCFALDGLRTSRAYLLVVLSISIFSWGFSLFREQLGAYVPLPYTLALSSREHLSIILALIAAQLAALVTYQMLFRLISAFATLPALLTGVTAWLGVYSSIAYGTGTGRINFHNELPEFLLASLIGVLLLIPYAMHARHRNRLMPVGSLLRFFRFWITAQANEHEARDNSIDPQRTISELQLLNNTLRQQQQLIDNQLEHSPLGALFLDTHGIITRNNPAGSSLLGNGADTGKNLPDSLRNLGINDFSLDSMSHHGHTKTFQYHSATQGEHWLEIMVTALYDREKSTRLIGHHVQLKDITASTQAQRRDLVAHRVQDIHKTGRVITHDFSNLLLGAEAQLERLGNGLSQPAQLDARDAIRHAFTHARAMLQQLGGGSQFGTPTLYPVQLDILLTDAISISAATAADRGVATRLEPTDPSFIEGDRAQLLRVFTNLIHNAIRACEHHHGSVIIRTQNQGRGVLIEISDSGKGMTDEQIAGAFDPGFSTKGQGQGGLGLSISYLMIDAHGGNLSLQHNPAGQGICARVWLPASRLCDEISHLDSQNVILLIDDEARRHQLTTQLEHHQHCQVAETTSIEETLALLADDSDWQHLVAAPALLPDTARDQLPASLTVQLLAD
jgi:signal transduction histidine kinase